MATKFKKVTHFKKGTVKEHAIIHIVHFEDKGQDLLNVTIEFYPDYMIGYIIDANAQKDIWTQYCVISDKPKKGQKLVISKSPADEVIDIKYKITKVETVK